LKGVLGKNQVIINYLPGNEAKLNISQCIKWKRIIGAPKLRRSYLLEGCIFEII